MITQGHPLYAVTDEPESATEIVYLIVGWQWTETGYVPVAVPLGHPVEGEDIRATAILGSVRWRYTTELTQVTIWTDGRFHDQ